MKESKSTILNTDIRDIFTYKSMGIKYTTILHILIMMYEYANGFDYDSPLRLRDVIMLDIDSFVAKIRKRAYIISLKTVDKTKSIIAEHGMHFNCTQEEFDEWIKN